MSSDYKIIALNSKIEKLKDISILTPKLIMNKVEEMYKEINHIDYYLYYMGNPIFNNQTQLEKVQLNFSILNALICVVQFNETNAKNKCEMFPLDYNNILKNHNMQPSMLSFWFRDLRSNRALDMKVEVPDDIKSKCMELKNEHQLLVARTTVSCLDFINNISIKA